MLLASDSCSDSAFMHDEVELGFQSKKMNKRSVTKSLDENLPL